MRVLYVDDEPSAITKFAVTARQIAEFDEAHTFLSPREALDFARAQPVDAAFLDIHMGEMDGLELARRFREISPEIAIVFVTAYDHYALEAFDVDALGYLLKPYTRDKLEREAQKIIRLRGGGAKRVRIQTMPRFEVFLDGKLLPISSPKPKELLALLVNRNGGAISSGQAIACLWEDKPNDERTKALYRMTLKRLREILLAAGIEDILGADGTQRYLMKEKVSCDYFDLLAGAGEARQRYGGEYMSEYAWAEDTNALLAHLVYGQEREE